MNKRIQELVEQAKASVPAGLPVSEWIDTYNRLLAQLIIRECVDVADDYVKDCTCDEHKNCKHPRSAIGRKIREHFGVKEC